MSGLVSNSQESELHLFILWEHARSEEQRILGHMRDAFEVLSEFEITWSQDKFGENLNRFYGLNLPPHSSKETHCGTGAFLLCIVKDVAPVYEPRSTSRGQEVVNTAMFDAKALYREWTGGGHKIHGTNSITEANHDITLLLGENIDDFSKGWLKKESQERHIMQQDVVASNGWNSVEQLLYVLNNTVRYAVLRNHEMLPENYYVEEHGDIDILCDNALETALILNAEKVFPEEYRVHYKARLGKDEVFFDLRYIGDGYYDMRWQKDLLDERELNERGFYVLPGQQHYYSLLYHALLHKPEFRQDYRDSLWVMGEKLAVRINAAKASEKTLLRLLSRYMSHRGYSYSLPDDQSVYMRHEEYAFGEKCLYEYSHPLRSRLGYIRRFLMRFLGLLPK